MIIEELSEEVLPPNDLVEELLVSTGLEALGYQDLGDLAKAGDNRARSELYKRWLPLVVSKVGSAVKDPVSIEAYANEFLDKFLFGSVIWDGEHTKPMICNCSLNYIGFFNKALGLFMFNLVRHRLPRDFDAKGGDPYSDELDREDSVHVADPFPTPEELTLAKELYREFMSMLLPRERTVFKLMLDGHTNNEIGNAIDRGHAQVERYRAAIMAQLDRFERYHWPKKEERVRAAAAEAAA